MKLKLEDTESRLNTKLAAANENLVSARNEVSKCEEKTKDLEELVKQKETQHFELKGEIAGKRLSFISVAKELGQYNHL